MTILIYTRLSKLFLFVSIGLCFISLLSGLFTFLSESPLILKLTREGFDHFLDAFNFPLKVLAAALAMFAVWLTLERLGQTERQLQAIIDNNNFNNYTKHTQEFIDHFKGEAFFPALSAVTTLDKRALIGPLYKVYYSDSYRTFRLTMKEDVRNNIHRFREAILNSPLSQPNCDILHVPLDIVKMVSRMASDDVDAMIEPLVDRGCEKLRARFSNRQTIPLSMDLLIEQFRHVNKIYWTSSFFRVLLSFDGVIESLGGSFHENFEKYRESLGFGHDAAS